jgi:tRNA threonylcarbamoyladenosine biosynthesis protein TsaB
MNILALDTSTRSAAVALALSDGRLFEAAPDPARPHGQALLPDIASLLNQARTEARALEAIAVGLGPGSYTGLRIGLTAAKTLAYVTGARLVGLDSLELLAQNAPADAVRIAVIADAQRGTLYSAAFRRTAAGEPLERVQETKVVARVEWFEGVQPGTLVLGPELKRLALDLPASVVLAPPEAGIPRGRHLVALARRAIEAGERCDPWLLEPVYLRTSSAEELWAKRK